MAVTHKRIRMFNTKDTYPNQSLDNDLCQAEWLMEIDVIAVIPD